MGGDGRRGIVGFLRSAVDILIDQFDGDVPLSGRAGYLDFRRCLEERGEAGIAPSPEVEARVETLHRLMELAAQYLALCVHAGADCSHE